MVGLHEVVRSVDEYNSIRSRRDNVTSFGFSQGIIVPTAVVIMMWFVPPMVVLLPRGNPLPFHLSRHIAIRLRPECY